MTVPGRTTGSRAAAVVFREGWALLRVGGSFAARLTADVAAVATILSLVVGLWQDGVAVALYSLVLLGQTVVRLAPLRAPVQAGTAVILVVAAWAAMLDAYQLIPWLDLVAHVVATGLLAALVAAAVLRLGWLPASPAAWPGHAAPCSAGVPGPAAIRTVHTLFTAGAGALLAVLWEAGEWFGHTFLDPAIQVGYEDTVGDLTAGVLGAALAGVFLDRLITDQTRLDRPVP